MKNRGADLAGRLRQFFLGSGSARRACILAAHILSGPARRRCCRVRRKASAATLRSCRGTQVIGHDLRRRIAVGRCDAHMAARGGTQIADAGRKRGKRVQGFAEFFQRQGLHVVLQIRRGLLRIGLGERPQLRRRHRHRARSGTTHIARPICILPNQIAAMMFRVFTPCTLKTMRSCKWSCRLSPTPARVDHGRDAMLLQQGRRADAGQLQQLRRTDGAGRQQGFPPGRRLPLRAAARKHDARADGAPIPSFRAADVPRGSPS